MKKRIEDPKQVEQLRRNLKLMQSSFTGKGLKNEPLHVMLRNKWNYETYDKDLRNNHPILHEALQVFRAWNTVYQQTSGRQLPTHELVDDLATFCSAAFSFDEDVTKHDLLTRDLDPFPPLRRESERWGRYEGLYRSFYLYPDTLEGDEEQLHGGLLQLREAKGKLLCRWVTGIRREERFAPLEQMLTNTPDEEFFAALTVYNKSLPSYEGRLVCYEGSMDPDVTGFFLLRMRRVGHPNAAQILLRRWDESAQAFYSGGVALVNLFRDQSKADMVCHAALITRERMSLDKERELLLRHLGYAGNGVRGLCVPVDMDRKWNQAVMEWGYKQSVTMPGRA